MLELTAEDRALVPLLREAGVFQEIVDNRLQDANGLIMLPCPDCDQTPELEDYLRSRMRANGIKPRIHRFGLNGGPLRLSPSSPLNRFVEDALLVQEFEETRDLKGISLVGLYAHAPCGKAYKHGLSLLQVIPLLFEGKQWILDTTTGFDVACFCHIDKGGDNKRTYYVSRTKWEEWLHTQP